MVDVMPTLLALAGGQGQPGPSLRRQEHLADAGRGQAVAARGHPDQCRGRSAAPFARATGNWSRSPRFPGKTELFDLADDPGEKNNVADQHPEIVRDLEARLLAYAKRAEAERMDQGPAAASSVPRARPSSIPTSTSTTAACRTRSRHCPGDRRRRSGIASTHGASVMPPARRCAISIQPGAAEAFEIMLAVVVLPDRHVLGDPGQRDVGLGAAAAPGAQPSRHRSARPCRRRR